eukprot:4923656-Karenia_brevis.AAC.1
MSHRACRDCCISKVRKQSGARLCLACTSKKPQQDFTPHMWGKAAAKNRQCTECIDGKACCGCATKFTKRFFEDEEWAQS